MLPADAMLPGRSGGSAQVKVLRDGEVKQFDIKLQPVESLVPVHQYDRLPCYYIYAGGATAGRHVGTMHTPATCGDLLASER
jgi:hypothetical protein